MAGNFKKARKRLNKAIHRLLKLMYGYVARPQSGAPAKVCAAKFCWEKEE